MKCDFCGEDHGDEPGQDRYIHCSLCIDELPSYMSASEYSRLEVVLTDSTLRVNCIRHKRPVLKFTFDPNEVEITPPIKLGSPTE